MGNGNLKDEVIKMKVCRCPYCKTFHWKCVTNRTNYTEEQ